MHGGTVSHAQRRDRPTAATPGDEGPARLAPARGERRSGDVGGGRAAPATARSCVHIGPYKTGTTAIQAASTPIVRSSPSTASPTPAPTTARCARAGRCSDAAGWARPTCPAASGTDGRRGPAAPGRVVISSEDFSSARPQHIARLVADLGPDRVHVLIVARRLDRLLPSAWQERVKSVNETRTYDAWLREVLAPSATARRPRTFWHHHGLARPDRAVARGAAARAGARAGHDESDRGVQPRAFERLLGLPEGQLTPGPARQHLPVDGADRALPPGQPRGRGRRLGREPSPEQPAPRDARRDARGADPGLRDLDPARCPAGPPRGWRSSARSGPDGARLRRDRDRRPRPAALRRRRGRRPTSPTRRRHARRRGGRGAMEQALARMLRRAGADRAEAGSAVLRAHPRPTLSSRALLREVARRQARKVRRRPPD